jgi:predicted RNA-binding Zn ribbon-like protein
MLCNSQHWYEGGYDVDPLWAALINSDWHDHLGSGRSEDRLGNERWLTGFLRQTGWQASRLPSAAERRRFRELRVLLRRMVDTLLAGEPIAQDDVRALNAILANAPVLRRLEPDGGGWRVELTTPGGDMDGVLGEIAASFAAMLGAGNADRIKICENPDCRWVMLDESRNRSRRWCDSSECGNVMKVRRYRARHRT